MKKSYRNLKKETRLLLFIGDMIGCIRNPLRLGEHCTSSATGK
jgi:hypothetical protein